MADTSLQVFRFGEKVEALKSQSTTQWPEISNDAMVFFAGEILASGVVLWALMNQTGLDTMRWPGDLPVVLGLKIATGQETKIGQALNLIADGAGLLGAEADQMKEIFLEMLEWNVVEQLHASLFAGQRQELSQILAHNNFSTTDRSKMLEDMAKFLQSAGIVAFDAQSYFEKALRDSLKMTYEHFVELIAVEKREMLKKMVG